MEVERLTSGENGDGTDQKEQMNWIRKIFLKSTIIIIIL